jgi:hypothetical protein
MRSLRVAQESDCDSLSRADDPTLGPYPKIQIAFSLRLD